MSIHFIKAESPTDELSLDDLSNQFKIINSGERRVAVIGTRNLSITHAQLIEVMASALVLSRNTVVTSGGASGVNSAVIRGALKSAPELLEVVLPQTLDKQSDDIQDLLKAVEKIEQHPERIDVPFIEASEICYKEIVNTSHQLICFLYHDSNILQRVIDYAKGLHKIITVFYLD